MSHTPAAASDRDWETFARELASFLYDAPSHTALIVEASGHRFVQFSRRYQALFAEVVGSEFLEFDHRLTTADEEELRGAGWELQEHGNWGRAVTTIEHASFATVTAAVVDALRDVLRVSGLHELEAHGFVEAHGRTVDFAQLRLGLHALPWRDDEPAATPDAEMLAELAGAEWLRDIERDISWHRFKSADLPTLVRRLRENLSPVAALHALGELARRRALADYAPWPQLPRHVATLAKAAGVSEFDAQRAVLERLLTVPSMCNAPLSIWQTWRPVLVEMAQRSRRVRGVLLRMNPRAKDIDGWWLELLRDCGLWEPLVGTDEHGLLGFETRAVWLSRTVAHPDYWETTDFRKSGRALWPVQLLDLIAAMAPALIADDVPVRLQCARRAGKRTWKSVIDLRVLETCLSHDVPITAPSDTLDPCLDLWLHQREPDDDLAATLADPVFGLIIAEMAAGRTDKSRLCRVPALRARLVGEPSPMHELDDPPAIARALDGDVSNDYSGGGLLRAIEMTSDLLRGLPVEDESGELHTVGSDHWHPLVHGIGRVALRAVSPVVSDRDRRYLLALLEIWSSTVFADTEAQLRIGWASTDQRVLKSDGGVAVTVGPAVLPGRIRPNGMRPFIELASGSGVSPIFGAVADLSAAPARWGTADQLRALIELVRERGPVPWDKIAPQVLSDRTGLSYAGSALILAGYLGWFAHRGSTDALLDAPVGLGRRALTDAGVELHGQDCWLSAELVLANVLPADPAELWEPGAMRSLAERVADAWNDRHGRRAQAPEKAISTVAMLSGEFSDTFFGPSAAEICSALLGPDECELLTTALDEPHPPERAVSGESRHYRFYNLTASLVHACRWAYAFLPVGDPMRAGVPRAVQLMRERMLEYRSEPYRTLHLERQWLTGPYSTAMVARTSSESATPGSYEVDPLASVPELVEEVSEHLRLDTDAARLYLQLITLMRPTDREVRQWNSWTPRHHAGVEDRLLTTGLVERDKRANAGRTLFVPARWYKTPGIEDYKTSLHGIVYDTQAPKRGFHAPLRPLPELFTEAWTKFGGEEE